jgi:hypothetical protein
MPSLYLFALLVLVGVGVRALGGVLVLEQLSLLVPMPASELRKNFRGISLVSMVVA